MPYLVHDAREDLVVHHKVDYTKQVGFAIFDYHAEPPHCIVPPAIIKPSLVKEVFLLIHKKEKEENNMHKKYR